MGINHIIFDKMKKIINILLLLAAAALLLAGCVKEREQFVPDGDTAILSLTLDEEYNGDIDRVTGKVTVAVPSGYDASEMTLTGMELSEGAEADVAVGTVMNMNFPQTLTVINGDVFSEYTIMVRHDKAEILTFTLDGRYSGSIEGNVINVFVPLETDVTAMSIAYTVPEGTSVDRKVGEILDFSSPVEITVTYNTAVTVYTVNVVKNDMSMEPKAFIGIKPSVEELGDEAKAAAEWAFKNIPNITYIYLDDIKTGTVKLDGYKMLWCHFDWTDWPSLLWETRDQFNAYYLKGGNILASRDGARYINDVWRVALDQRGPNNEFTGDQATLLEPDGFTVYAGAENHEIYKNLAVEDGKIFLRSAGAFTTNRTLQWGIDWDPYKGLDGWKTQTGATPLASDRGGDPNRVTIAEFAPREAAGSTSGTVITIGTPAFEWYDRNGASNGYSGNMEQLTKNAINYLCK